ncbi:MAG TPA: FixH family protein [Gammaproteobacteria bacterium]|nr:FixH family protein [Gammaproteobacteria bacterium]
MSAVPMQKPWYRERWPWLLMLPPAASVIGGFVLLYFAVESPNALVVDDYARIEEISAAEAVADRHAAERGLAADVALSAGERGDTRLTVQVTGDLGAAPPATLVLRLRHAGNAAGDRTVTLTFDGRAYGGRAALIDGRYDFAIEPEDGVWRLAGAVGRAPTTVHVTATAPE